MGFLSTGGLLGIVQGFEEKQYELGEIQREKTKDYEAQLKLAAQGMGQVRTKRKKFDEQVSTFAAALENDSSLKNKLSGLGPSGIRNLAKSALNTRYAEGGAGGSKFRVSDLIRQVKKTRKDDLNKFKVVPPKTQKKDKKEDSTSSSGIFGNFANILSPTRAGEQQRSILKERFAEKFPNATEEELADAIKTYGQMGGSTNEVETGTPFSVGVALSPRGQVAYQEIIQGKLQVLVDDDSQGKRNPGAIKRRNVVGEVLNERIQRDDYSQGESDKLLEDADNLYKYLRLRDEQKQKSVTKDIITATMIIKKLTTITEYIEFMQKNPNYDPYNPAQPPSGNAAPAQSPSVIPPPSGGWVLGSKIP